MARIDHIDTVACRKMNHLPGWEPYAWETIGTDGIKVTGGIPRILTRGNRKGQKKWDGKGDIVIVVKYEIDAEESRYETETGKCHNCMGTGDVVAGVSVETGTRYKPCNRCNGSGASPVVE